MKRNILLLTVLTSFTTLSGAEDFDKSKLSVGASYGFINNGVLSVRGDYDISESAKAPVKIRVGYDRYSIDTGAGVAGYSWGYNVYYGSAYYDFNKQLKVDAKVHPFLGLGLGFGTTSCTGWCNGVASPTVGGFFLMGGVQYDLQKNINLEAGINGWSGLSLGGNYKF